MPTLIDDFSGKDLKVSWTPAAGNDKPGITIKDYVVDFVVNDEIKRTEYVEGNKCTYYFDDMCLDQSTQAPSRTVSVRVRTRDVFLRESASALGTFTNPSPPAVTFTAQPFIVAAGSAGKVHIKISPVTDNDLMGYQIFRSTSSGFAPSTDNRIYIGHDLSFFDETVVAGTTYYYKVAAYDKFATTVASLNFGSQVSATGSFVFEVVDIKFADVAFTPDSPSANRLSWTGGNAYRTIEGSNTTITKSVPSGSLTASTAERYVYFDWDLGTMQANTSILTALAKANNRILATYKGGTDLISGVNEPIMDGSRILAHTIGASQLVVTTAVITGSAQIANAIIGNAHITDLNAAKINAGYINAARIQAGTINTSHMTSNTIHGNRITFNTLDGSKIVAGSIETGHMTANTIHGNRITAGSLSVNRLAANSITAAYLRSDVAVITNTAQISNAIITGAKIGNLTVDTINIKKGALGFFLEKENAAYFDLSKGVERILISYSIPSNLEGKIAIIGTWSWEADDDPDVRYRILRSRGSTTTVLGNYLANRGHGEVGVNFSMAAADNVVPGDIIRLTLTRAAGGGVGHMFSNMIFFGVLR